MRQRHGPPEEEEKMRMMATALKIGGRIMTVAESDRRTGISNHRHRPSRWDPRVQEAG